MYKFNSWFATSYQAPLALYGGYIACMYTMGWWAPRHDVSSTELSPTNLAHSTWWTIRHKPHAFVVNTIMSVVLIPPTVVIAGIWAVSCLVHDVYSGLRAIGSGLFSNKQESPTTRERSASFSSTYGSLGQTSLQTSSQKDFSEVSGSNISVRSSSVMLNPVVNGRITSSSEVHSERRLDTFVPAYQ